ncbi:MAG: class I SAM-dependent methyltransferase [Candidatus Omnitrophica bacterium]|nr:class I SAM-dependent methyltransferase [Candidatus Omnitrophota bacterium]MCM8790627.1 class I SAM-dependent methyltransferase [Candidatus Omnitrophota bacterium]
MGDNYKKAIFSNYIDSKDSDYTKVHRSNQESYSDNFRDLLPSDKHANILEIGSGAGQFLFYLKDKGYSNIEGIDIGEEQIRFLNKLGIKGSVISSIPSYLDSRSNHYDLIVMNQVIEHFSKDELWENLRSIYGSLKPGGILLVATPNMACVSGLFQRYTDFTHEIGFTERSAYQVMRIAGFKDIAIRGDRIRLKMRPQRILWWLLNSMWTAVLGYIYYLEKGMDRPKVLSRNLIIVCKK